MTRHYLFQVCLRLASADVLVNSWPSPVGNGSTDVSIEYEIDSNASPLENVVIIIPLPMYPSLREESF